MQPLGLDRSITSIRQFHVKVGLGYKDALELLQVSAHVCPPNTVILRDLHRVAFNRVLLSVGDFRHTDHQRSWKAVDAIDTASEAALELPTRASEMTRVKAIAKYVSVLMKESPFPDVDKKPFFNRTLAACVIESQLKACFPKPDLKLTIDALEFDSAFRSFQPPERALSQIVKKMTGGKANLIDLEKRRQEMKQTIERSK